MKYFVSSLVWQEFKTIGCEQVIAELDKFADHKFDNGISVRISTGKMAHTNAVFPYELNVLYPNGEKKMIPKLNSAGLNNMLNKLDSGNYGTFD